MADGCELARAAARHDGSVCTVRAAGVDVGWCRWRLHGLHPATTWVSRATTSIARRRQASHPRAATGSPSPRGRATRTPVSLRGTYYYRVTAEDAAGNVSSASAQLTAVVPAASAGLVAAYGFNAGSGSSVADSSAAGNTGSLSGATWNAAGRYGSALSFDGVNDWVTSARRELARPDECDDARGVGSPLGARWLADGRAEGADGRSRLRALRRPGRRAPARRGLQRLGANATGTAALPLNTWTHLATTFDGLSFASTSTASSRPRPRARERWLRRQASSGSAATALGGSGLPD